MNEIYSIKLSTMELYVAASMLGYDFLVGIEGKTLDRNIPHLDASIDEAQRNLQKNELMSIDISGKLRVKKELKQLISLIAVPECVISVADNLLKNSKRVINIYSHDNIAAFVTRKVDSNKYSIFMIDDFDMEEQLDQVREGFFPEYDTEEKEVLIYKELVEVKDMISNFRENQAREKLSSMLKNQNNLELVFDSLIGKNERIMIKVYSFYNHKLITTGSEIYVKSGDVLMAIESNSAELVSYIVYR